MVRHFYLLIAALNLSCASFAAEFPALPEDEADLLTHIRSIFPRSEVWGPGPMPSVMPTLTNPTDWNIRIWLHVDRDADDCLHEYVIESCKGETVYAVVEDKDLGGPRFGFRTHLGFRWWVTDISGIKLGDYARCVMITLQEEMRAKGALLPSGDWPTRETRVCLTPEGFVEVK